MAKIDIISGFLGAGKTTLIKKLIAEAFQGEKLVLIENEFGEIGIDGGFLKEAGIQITEMNSGCICCSLVGDFGEALKEVLDKYNPDRVIIEPSGVGKLSDVIKAVKNTGDSVVINSTATVVDASKCKMYMKNYGEFYNNQIEYAGTVILSRTQNVSEDKLDKCLKMIREKNDEASIITTPWDDINGKNILEAMEKVNSLEKELIDEHEHHHHHHDEDEHEHHHHHHHDEDEDHDHDHHHHHHHDHPEGCTCGHCHHNEDTGEAEEYGIGTYVYVARRPMNINLFDDFVARRWPKNIIRAKGLCYFADETHICYVFEQAGKQVSLRNAGQWYATMPEEEFNQFVLQNPDVLRDWDQVYGDRMQKIVFIGQHLDRKAIKAELDACLIDL